MHVLYKGTKEPQHIHLELFYNVCICFFAIILSYRCVLVSAGLLVLQSVRCRLVGNA